jgi:putative FmdB family regulatory protein
MLMPIYEFHCEQCGAESEILVRSADWRGVECPHCGSKQLSKKFSTFAATGAASAAGPSPSGNGGGHCCSGHCGCH